MEEIDIYRAAWLLVRRHGDDAVLEAARGADARLDVGDLDGKNVWARIMGAIDELLDRDRKGVSLLTH